MELTPTQKLDKFLTYFMEIGETESGRIGRISNEIHEETGQGDKKEMFEILHKLQTDGYVNGIRRPYKGKDVTMYFSTFDGRLFYLNGGYQAKFSNDENIALLTRLEVTRQKTLDENSEKNQKRLNQLTFWLMVGTLAIVLWQVFLYFYPVHKDYPYWIWTTIRK